jgi:hypothetical protein
MPPTWLHKNHKRNEKISLMSKTGVGIRHLLPLILMNKYTKEIKN